jgi:enamine deaminase RidA (YjgF/YER057c/UK114 family)
MAGRIEARLAERNIELPDAPSPVGSYVPYAASGSLLFVSGQIPLVNGALPYKGRLGAEIDLEQGQAIARICGLNIIAQVKAACGGDLDRVQRCLRLSGYVACTDEFTQHPAVVNGASDLMTEVFGDAGLHTRIAVGSTSLPLGVPVEIESIWEFA